MLTQAGPQSSYVSTVLPACLLFGIGAGLAFMPLLTIAMANVPAADAGMASGIISTSLQLAAAPAVAVLGTVAADRTRTLAAAGNSLSSALLGGDHLAFAVPGGCVAVAVVLADLTIRAPRPERVEPAPEVDLEAA